MEEVNDAIEPINRAPFLVISAGSKAIGEGDIAKADYINNVTIPRLTEHAVVVAAIKVSDGDLAHFVSDENQQEFLASALETGKSDLLSWVRNRTRFSDSQWQDELDFLEECLSPEDYTALVAVYDEYNLREHLRPITGG